MTYKSYQMFLNKASGSWLRKQALTRSFPEASTPLAVVRAVMSVAGV